MTLYALIDEDGKVARHLSKGTLSVFSDLKQLKKHSWRYESASKKYKIAELEITQTYDKDGKRMETRKNYVLTFKQEFNGQILTDSYLKYSKTVAEMEQAVRDVQTDSHVFDVWYEEA